MTPLRISQMLVRACGALALVLGLLFWLGDLRSPMTQGLHMLLGIVLVLSLYVVAYLGARAGVSRGLAVGAVVWGLVTLWFGLAQQTLVPDPSLHWIVQVVHLVLGMGAIGLGEAIAGQATRLEAGQAPVQARSSGA